MIHASHVGRIGWKIRGSNGRPVRFDSQNALSVRALWELERFGNHKLRGYGMLYATAGVKQPILQARCRRASFLWGDHRA